MAIFKSKTAPLGPQLVTKAQALRTKQAEQADASESFIRASQSAQIASNTADKHATAVEKALGILEEAGVVL